MSSPVSGLLSWGERLRRLPQQALDTATAPVSAFQEKFPGMADMLGMHHDPQQTTQADPGMVKQANQSFVDAMNRKQMQRGK